ncbi:MAG: insulinase family protein [Myxococcales bacterium]|nr:insulinase family protein [Myxococcales bacterium]
MTRAAVIAAVLLGACCPTPPRATGPVVTAPPPPPPPDDPGPPAPPPLAWDAAGIDWTTPPDAWPEVAFTPPIPTEFTLRNGARVLVVENHRLPLVSVRVAIAAAGSRADGAKAGLAALTADLLDEGAGARTALELPEELERLGASLTVGAGLDYAQVSLDAMAATLPEALALTADVLMRPRLTADDFGRVKAERLADLALRGDQPTTIARLVFARAVFGGHPYAAPTDGYATTVGALQPADAKKFFRAHYGPSAATIVVVGDVTVADARAVLERTLGGWRQPVAIAKAPPAPVARAPQLVFVDRPDAPQSVVVLGRLGPDVGDPALAADEVINTAIGGSFASRLNTLLREQKGYTYGIGSQFNRAQWAGSWRVFSQVRSDVTVPAIKDALAIVTDAGTTPLPAAELAKAQALIIRGLPQDFETNAQIASAYTNAALDGRPLTYFRDLPGQVSAVTAEQARAGAAAAWRDLTIVVVGDWAAIGAELATLGLPIVRYDVDGNPTK